MKLRGVKVLFAAMLLVSAALVRAEEKFGVPVYPGAAYDEATTQFVTKMSADAEVACYRTDDEAAKVVEFYEKQPGMDVLRRAAQGGMLKRGNVDVTVQNPWMNPESGKMMNVTLISIVKHKK